MSILRATLGGLCLIAAIPAFFDIAGGYDWFHGWLFIGVIAVCHGASAVFVIAKDPGLLKRRSRFGKGTRAWDVVLLSLFGLLFCGAVLIAALDERNGWSPLPGWLPMAGAGLYALFVAGLTWAMVVNTHFEKTVRIAVERDHRVVQEGPYRFVRHPGYLAVLVGFLPAPPLLLASGWAAAPAALAAVTLVLRTALEDGYLRRELTGYEEYASRVRYRLLPGVW